MLKRRPMKRSAMHLLCLAGGWVGVSWLWGQGRGASCHTVHTSIIRLLRYTNGGHRFSAGQLSASPASLVCLSPAVCSIISHYIQALSFTNYYFYLLLEKLLERPMPGLHSASALFVINTSTRHTHTLLINT